MKDDKTALEAIVNCCNDIGECIEFFGKVEEDFFSNKFFQVCCAFYLSQIGETVKLLSFELMEENFDIPWKNIIGLRNIIVHDYGKIRISSLWETVTNWVPELKGSCERILAEIGYR
ncbi:MAG: DUF86 domain-containing protein [Methanomassiliicoccaceae archaeon]|nr:DUF86 domain-containing protein [Methanomassiliicoccaceae archaeon]